MKSPKLSLSAIKDKAAGYTRAVRPYSFVIFLIFVAAIYGYTLLTINTLSKAQPSESAVTSQVQQAQILQIDPHVVEQLKSLQDNSVSVQTLFDQARSNPFQQ